MTMVKIFSRPLMAVISLQVGQVPQVILMLGR